MKDFIRVMKALSDPKRVIILKLLGNRILCVCELQAILKIPQPTVSKHLKQLEKAGLVTSFKEGLWVNYKLSDGVSSPYSASLLGNIRHWLSDEPEVKKLAALLPRIKREDICGSSSRNRMEQKR